MWNKIMEVCGLVIAFVMAIFLGKSMSKTKQAKKEAEEAEDKLKKEAEYKAEAHKIKEEIFKEAESEKQTLNKGDSADRFNSAINILRNHKNSSHS